MLLLHLSRVREESASRRGGISGHAEGTPINHRQEFPREASRTIDAIAGQIVAGDPQGYQKYLTHGARFWLGSLRLLLMLIFDDRRESYGAFA